MADPKPNIYYNIIKDNRSMVCKAKARERYEKLRDATPKVLELLEDGIAESRIADETGTSPDFVKWVKWKSDFEKRSNSFEVKLYELARCKEYQQEISGCKPIKLSVTALLTSVGSSKTHTEVANAIKKMDLEQIIEGQIRENLTNVVFSEEYYNVKTHGIDYKTLANNLNTWPCIVRRMIRELNIKQYLNFAFKNAQKYGLQPQQIGLLLVYSDEGQFKDRHCVYNYVGLAKQAGLPLDKVVEILKHR